MCIRDRPEALFSGLTVSDPRALLWAFKPAEEGIQAGLIARVWNVSDAPLSAELQLAPTPVAGALRTSHIETDQGPAAVGPGGLSFSLASQQMGTWRLLLDGLPPTVYCTAKANSLGCVPAIGWSGTPSASAGSGFVLSADDVLGNVPGIFFYGLTGATNQPFQGGTLCVRTPLWRAPAQSSGGTPGSCSGSFAFDFNAYAASGADPKLVAGAVVNGQYWSRDPADPFSSNLTDAIEFTLQP